MAAAREITPYIRLRSEFAMMKNVNKIGPISELGRRWIVRDILACYFDKMNAA